MTITLHFGECEHVEDLDNYLDDVRNSGATVISKLVDHDNEEGTATITVPDDQRDNFWIAFKKTESYDYMN